MGYYIEVNSNFKKANLIVESYQGVHVNQPASFKDVPEDKALICVVNNYIFEAAAFVYDESEFKAFTEIGDMRPRDWVLIDRKLAEKLTGFTN